VLQAKLSGFILVIKNRFSFLMWAENSPVGWFYLIKKTALARARFQARLMSISLNRFWWTKFVIAHPLNKLFEYEKKASLCRLSHHYVHSSQSPGYERRGTHVQSGQWQFGDKRKCSTAFFSYETNEIRTKVRCAL